MAKPSARRAKSIPSQNLPVPVRVDGKEIALPEQLIGKAKDYRAKARSKRTLIEYAKHWRKFDAWCKQSGRDPLPANAETMVGYVTWMAEGQGIEKPLSAAYITIAVSAIRFR